MLIWDGCDLFVSDEEFVERCYRNTGAVPVPRKISKSYNQPLRRKISAPAAPPAAPRPRIALPRQLSCPEPQPQPLHSATQQETVQYHFFGDIDY